MARADLPLASYGVTWEGDNKEYQATLSYLDGGSRIENRTERESVWAGEFATDFDEKGVPVTTFTRTEINTRTSRDLLQVRETEPTISRYILEGEVLCSGIEGYAYLEAATKWNGEDLGRGENVVRNVSSKERFQGTSEWRPFAVVCVGNPSGQTGYSDFKVQLKWAGTGKLSFRDVKLVEYRHAFPTTPQEQRQAKKWGWIGGIAGGIVGTLGGLAGVSATVWRARRRRREEELRRIAAAD